MHGERTFRIDAFEDSAFRYLDRDAIVCIDIITSSTTVVTAVAQGRRVFAVADAEAAHVLSATIPNALLAGEVEGAVPRGFDLGDSPCALGRAPARRPVVLAAPGTALMVNAAAGNSYIACFRNLSATAAHLAAHHEKVVILGAGLGGEFRCEDQMASAMMGHVLVAHGYEPEDIATMDLLARWNGKDAALTRFGRSAAELLRAHRGADLDFVLNHFDDLQLVCRQVQGEVVGMDLGRLQAQEVVRGRRAVGQWWGEEWGAVIPFAAASGADGTR